MKAIAVRPGVPDSVHLRDVPRPLLDDVPDGRGVRVGIIRAGLCGTDADLLAGEYGRAPEGADYLVLGHESLGRVLEVGPSRGGDDRRRGQLVVVTIRRPGSSVYDRIGRPDLSTDHVFIETGISRAHGFMTEEVVTDARYLVPVPDALEAVAVLTEPLSCITKSLRQVDAGPGAPGTVGATPRARHRRGHHRPAGHAGAAPARPRRDHLRSAAGALPQQRAARAHRCPLRQRRDIDLDA